MRTDVTCATLALVVAALGGCAGTGGQLGQALGADPSWGEANRKAYAAQTIDPAPHYDAPVPEGSGAHAAAAVERYRMDKVKTPAPVTSSRVGRTAAGASAGGAN